MSQKVIGFMYKFSLNLALSLLEKLASLYRDLTSGKESFPNLFSTVQFFFTQSGDDKLGLLSLLSLLLDLICKLNGRRYSLTTTQSTVYNCEKLASLLHLLANENNPEVLSSNVDVPQCAWSTNVKLVCMCMLMCPLWTSLAAKNTCDVLAHRVDLNEQVEKLLKILKSLRVDIWGASGFKEQMSAEVQAEFLGYKLFIMYSLLRFLLTLLNNCVYGETASCSSIDLTRKLYSKDYLKTLVDYGGCDLIVFVAVSLNNILSGENLNAEFENLLEAQARLVLTVTGNLVSSLKRATLCKQETDTLVFSLERLSTSTSNSQKRRRFSHLTSTSSLNVTPESSSEEDWKQKNESIISQCHKNSGKGEYNRAN